MAKYYIGGKRYSTEEATLLCAHHELFTSETLFCSPNGQFFMVTEADCETENKVVLLDRAAAFEFMDEHPAGIDTDNYDRLLGEPAQG